MVDLPLPDDTPSGAASPAGSGDEALRRIIARVRAWQHRQPLARRITPKDVVGVGIIALPYAPNAATAALPEALQPLFHQPRLLPGLSHQALVDFAARHAVAEPPGPADWPRRDIERADASSEPAPQTRYLLTAAVSDARSHAVSPRRLLLAPLGTAIWGRREWSRPRVALAAGVALLLAGAVPAAGWLQGRTSTDKHAVVAFAPASAAPTASAGVMTPVVPAAAPAASQVAPSAPSAPSPASVSNVPGGTRPTPSRPAQAAASEPGRLTAGRGVAAAPSEPHFALISAPARKRAGAEATLQRVQQLLGPALGSMQAQVMPTPEGYVVTIWPLPTQADAERLAEVLARRGVPMKWMEF